uniref:Uncharacterized protein n=1 Tax=Solanum tuberosum TaxID=4113 RepID=M1A7E1_SOLTU
MAQIDPNVLVFDVASSRASKGQQTLLPGRKHMCFSLLEQCFLLLYVHATGLLARF